MDAREPQLDAAEVARQLAEKLERRSVDYALGGAVALGYWAEPRGTIDVDLTLYVPPEEPSECVYVLQEIGCEVKSTDATLSLREHGFCRVHYERLRVDVFVPIVPFYETAKDRRRQVILGTHTVYIWDAETLAVFKMMFFRRKDVADVERILAVQGAALDREWVRSQLVELYGVHDPRLAQWDELCREVRE